MTAFLITVAFISLMISKVALFMYLLLKFYDEITVQMRDKKVQSREVRKIKLPEPDPSQTSMESKKTILRITTLLWTLAIGELVGYIFLMLSQHPSKVEVLKLNAYWLFLGALLCQLLTIINGWLKIKLNWYIRLGFLIGLVILATILMAIAQGFEIQDQNPYLLCFVLAFFLTTVFALILMLINALLDDRKIYPFDYNHYLRLSILLGLIVGSGIFFNFSLKI